MTGDTKAKERALRPSEGGGRKPVHVIITFIAVFIVYLFLTAPSGDILWWSMEEIAAGVILGLLAAWFGSKFLFLGTKDARMANPVRWVTFIVYFIGPFFFAMFKANIDVAYRVITGKINPGIVRIRTDLKSDLAVTLLANSITLTPGTLTVDIDERTNDLFIHWINVDEGALNRELNECDLKPVCGKFRDWVRRIAE